MPFQLILGKLFLEWQARLYPRFASCTSLLISERIKALLYFPNFKDHYNANLIMQLSYFISDVKSAKNM